MMIIFGYDKYQYIWNLMYIKIIKICQILSKKLLVLGLKFMLNIIFTNTQLFWILYYNKFKVIKKCCNRESNSGLSDGNAQFYH